jgi:electron transfer flavoprotein beta subunit
VRRELEGGLAAVVDIDPPAVITVQTGGNRPRFVTFRAIKQAEATEIAILPAPAIDQRAYRIRRMFTPPRERRARMLEGSPAEIAQAILALVHERLG